MKNNVQLVYWRYGSKIRENFSAVRDAASIAVIISDNGDGFIEEILENGVSVWTRDSAEWIDDYYERLL